MLKLKYDFKQNSNAHITRVERIARRFVAIVLIIEIDISRRTKKYDTIRLIIEL